MLQTLPSSIRPIARLFILQQFLSPLNLLSSVYLMAMVDFHMDATTIASVMCCLYITSFIFEIPSGVWADQFSRRKVLMIADLISGTGFAIMGLFPNPIGFGIGLMCLALRATMYSGTFDAYAYDELAHYDGQEYFGRVMSLVKIAQWLSVTITAVGVWVYHEYGWGTVAFLSVFGRLMGFIVLYMMPEVGKVKLVERISFRQQLREALHSFRVHKRILWIGLYSCSFGYVFMFYEYRAILAQEWSLPTLAITLCVAAGSLAYCLAGVVSTFWRRDTWRSMLLLGFASAALALTAFTISNGYIAAICFVLTLLVAELWLIRSGIMLQHATPSHVRASTGSIINFSGSILDIALAQFLGLMAGAPPRYLPPAHILSIGGFILASVLLISYLIKRPAETSN